MTQKMKRTFSLRNNKKSDFCNLLKYCLHRINYFKISLIGIKEFAFII
jgi:hypothetical protein